MRDHLWGGDASVNHGTPIGRRPSCHVVSCNMVLASSDAESRARGRLGHVDDQTSHTTVGVLWRGTLCTELVTFLFFCKSEFPALVMGQGSTVFTGYCDGVGHHLCQIPVATLGESEL